MPWISVLNKNGNLLFSISDSFSSTLKCNDSTYSVCERRMILTGEDRRTGRTTCLSATSFSYKDWPEVTLGLQCDRPATDRLSHCKLFSLEKKLLWFTSNSFVCVCVCVCVRSTARKTVWRIAICIANRGPTTSINRYIARATAVLQETEKKSDNSFINRHLSKLCFF